MDAVSPEGMSTVGIPSHVPADLVVDVDGYNPGPDYHAACKDLQTRYSSDVVWTTRNGGHWIALRGALISRAWGDYENFSSEVAMVPRERNDAMKPLLSNMNPPQHGLYRKPLNSAIRSPRKVREIEEHIRESVLRILNRIEPKGCCDFVSEFSEILPIEVFLGLVDLPIDDAAKLHQWAVDIAHPDVDDLDGIISQFSEYLRPYIRARRLKPGTDAISEIARHQVNGEFLSEDDAIYMAIQLMEGGLDTVVNMLAFAFEFLAMNPVHRQSLIDNPALIGNAIEEFLRRFGLANAARLVRSDFDANGVTLKAGDIIFLPSALHGLDDRDFDNAWQVDFHRANKVATTFGQGPHRCPGENLARAELRIAISEWLKRIPYFEIDPDQDVIRSGGVVAGLRKLPLRWSV